MKEGKQQQKFQIKVKTVSGVEKVFSTANVLSPQRTYSHTELSDIIQQLAGYSITVALKDPIIKIEQGTVPPSSDNTIMVPTNLLSGLALDYALADVMDWTEPFYGLGTIRLNEDHYLTYDEPDPDDEPDAKITEATMTHYGQWAPSRMMSIAGYLMKSLGVSVAPTSHEVKNPRVIATYKRSDFDTEVTKVEAPSYEEAICLALVTRNNGEWTYIPADFEQYLLPQTI